MSLNAEVQKEKILKEEAVKRKALGEMSRRFFDRTSKQIGELIARFHVAERRGNVSEYALYLIIYRVCVLAHENREVLLRIKSAILDSEKLMKDIDKYLNSRRTILMFQQSEKRPLRTKYGSVYMVIEKDERDCFKGFVSQLEFFESLFDYFSEISELRREIIKELKKIEGVRSIALHREREMFQDRYVMSGKEQDFLGIE
jgi:hypothetical protein